MENNFEIREFYTTDDKKTEAVRKGRKGRTFIINSVMPDSDPASPEYIRVESRPEASECGMTPF